MELKIIARIYNDFTTKFGLPRQSGIVEEIRGKIIFEKEYSILEAVRGLEEFSHIWLIWGFSEVERREEDTKKWSPTVRPPRLGGNKRMGVFATRSPFRPNRLGLSCVKLCGIEYVNGKLALEVAGADLMNGTPIYDIKPYLPFSDSRPEAASGFAGRVMDDKLEVFIPDVLLEKVPEDLRETLYGVLKGDPRPSYQNDPERIYGFVFGKMDIRFKVAENMLTVCDVGKYEV